MFIKVLSKDHESLYECDRYHLRQTHGLDQGGGAVNTTIYIVLEKDDSPKEAITLQLERSTSGLSVYVMNSDGRTIDTIFSNRN